MRLILDNTLINLILKQWKNNTFEYDDVYKHHVFRELLAHAEDFDQKTIGAEQYLNRLLHIDNIDMKLHINEIERNLNIIQEIDFSDIEKELEPFLPEDIYRKLGDIYVFPMIGIGGLSIGSFIVIDPSPCPWFPADGSDKEKYLNEFIKPLIRHEVHHAGNMQIRPLKKMSQIHNLYDLAIHFVEEMQSEGSALLCQNLCYKRTLSACEIESGINSLKKFDSILQKWIILRDNEINEEEWDIYYSLWGEEKVAYWLGEFIFQILIQFGYVKSVSEYMVIEPFELIQMIKSVIAKYEQMDDYTLIK